MGQGSTNTHSHASFIKKERVKVREIVIERKKERKKEIVTKKEEKRKKRRRIGKGRKRRD